MKHLIVVFAAALVLVPAAGARMLGGRTPVHVVTAAPTRLRAFLLRPDETPQKYYPRTPSFSWNPVNATEPTTSSSRQAARSTTPRCSSRTRSWPSRRSPSRTSCRG